MPPSTNSVAPSSLASINRPARRAKPELPYTILTMDIPSYSESKKMANGSNIKSPKLDAGGYYWRIVCYPNSRRATTPAYISLYLQLNPSAADDDDDVKVQYQFMILQPGGGVGFLSDKIVGMVNRKEETHGFECYVRRDDLENSACLKDDCLKIRCDVTVLEKLHVVKAVAPAGRLNADLGHLLATMEGADVDFEVHGKVFRAHRCILAARSPVFMADFFGLEKKGSTG